MDATQLDLMFEATRNERVVSMSLTVSPDQPPSGFDYSSMSVAVADKARAAIETFHRGHNDIMQTVVLVGYALLDVREALDHGVFGQWLKAEFGPGERTAQNYMNVARRFGDKTEIISDLPLALTYQLSAPAVPDEVREEIVSRIEQDRIPANTVREMILQAKDNEKKRKAAERVKTRRGKLTDQQRKEEDRKEKARRRSRAQREQDARDQHEKDLLADKAAAMADMRVAKLILDVFGAERDALVALLKETKPHQFAPLRVALGGIGDNGLMYRSVHKEAWEKLQNEEVA